MRKLAAGVVVVILLAVIAGCSAGKEPVSLTVGAGAGLSEAMPVLGQDFERSHPGIAVSFNFASAGAVSAQVRQGAPLDALVVPSGGGYLDALEQEGLIFSDSRCVVARDDLVLAIAADRSPPRDPWSWLGTPEVRRVAIGDPGSVPAGTYALQTLRYLGLEDPVKPKLLYARTVRQALMYVEQGEAEAALVYRSTAHGSKKARVAAVAPAETHEPIVFEGAVVKATRHPEEARLLLKYLRSPEAARVLEEYGFKAPN